MIILKILCTCIIPLIILTDYTDYKVIKKPGSTFLFTLFMEGPLKDGSRKQAQALGTFYTIYLLIEILSKLILIPCRAKCRVCCPKKKELLQV